MHTIIQIGALNIEYMWVPIGVCACGLPQAILHISLPNHTFNDVKDFVVREMEYINMGKPGPQLGRPKRDLRSDIVDLEANLEQARNLARIFYKILIQQPTDLVEYDDRLEVDKLPDWLIGRARRMKITTENW
jgi:hypothetical protein